MSLSPNPIVDVSMQIVEQVNTLILNQEAAKTVSIPAVGIQGPRGYSMLSGIGIPDVSLGINNDLYVNLTNGYLYKKISNAWVFKFNIVPQVEKITVTQQMINANGLHLSITPLNPNSVTLSFVGGVGDQDNGEDFSVSGDFVGWSGLGLQGFIEVGDILKIRY